MIKKKKNKKRVRKISRTSILPIQGLFKTATVNIKMEVCVFRRCKGICRTTMLSIIEVTTQAKKMINNELAISKD